MKKFSLYMLSLLFVLLTGLYLQNMLSKPILKEFSLLKAELAKIEKNSRDLDFNIQAKSSETRSDLSILVDSLKKVQTQIQEKYVKTRGELISLYEEGQPNFVSRKIAENKGHLTLASTGLVFLVLVFIGVKFWKKMKPSEKKQSLSRKNPSGETIVPIVPEFRRSLPKDTEKVKENAIQNALKGLSNIALQINNSSNALQTSEKSLSQPQFIPESSDNKEDNTVQVSHLLKEETKEIPGRDFDANEIKNVPHHIHTEQDGQSQQREIKKPEIDKQEKWVNYQKEESKKIVVLKLARKGSTVSEISQRLKISKTEIELMIRAHRMKQ